MTQFKARVLYADGTWKDESIDASNLVEAQQKLRNRQTGKTVTDVIPNEAAPESGR